MEILVAPQHLGPSQIRDQTLVSCRGSRFLTPEPPGQPLRRLLSCLSGCGLLPSSFITVLGAVRAGLPVPDCVLPAVSCGPPPELPLAEVFGRPRLRYEVDTVLRYRCREGLTQRNLPLIRCQEDGRWAPPQISCVPRRPVSARRREVGDTSPHSLGLQS